MYPHYFLPLLPSLAVLSAIFVGEVLGQIRQPAIRLGAQTAAVLGATAFFIIWNDALLAIGWNDHAIVQSAVAVLRKQGLRPQEPILVISQDLDLYLESGAGVATPFPHPLSLLCPLPLTGADAALAGALAVRPGFIIVPGAQNHRLCDLPQKWSLLTAALSRDYCVIAVFARPLQFAPDYRFSIYARRASADSVCRHPPITD